MNALCRLGLHRMGQWWTWEWMPPFTKEWRICQRFRCRFLQERPAIAAAARQGGDGTAPAESPQSGGDKPHRPNSVTQHQSGDRHGR